MKRWILIVFATLLFLVAGVLIGGPYFAKYYIEKNGKELVGRKIAMHRLHFNALNGHVLITNFKLFEPDDSARFVEFDTLFMNLTLHKLFSGHLFSEALHIKGIRLNVWMEGDTFNFSDLIPEEDSTQTDTTEESFIKNYTFNDIQILGSQVHYEDRILPATHNLKDINIKLPGISFGNEQAKAGLEFALTDGGTFTTNLDYNQTTSDFVWQMQVDKLNLAPFIKYAQADLNISNLQGWFSGDVTIRGNANTPTTPIVSGSMNVNDFSLSDLQGKEVLAFSSVFIDAKELNLATGNYHFGKLQVNRPVINAVLTPKGDNLSALMKEAEAVADTLKKKEERLTEETPLTYLLDEFRLTEGVLTFEDRTLKSGVFNYKISSINFAADALTEGKPVTFLMDALLNGKGTFNAKIVTDPGNPGDGTFNVSLKNTPVADFSRYCEDATGFPLTAGRVSFQTENSIVNSYLKSHIVFNMYKTGLAKKRKDITPEMDVPLKLGVAVLQDNKGRILIDVPAEGNVDDPEFRYRKLIWKVVMNVLVKAATSPYNLLANAVGVDEEKLKFVRMELLQEELGPEQTTQLDMIAQILQDKPDLNIEAVLAVNTNVEAEEVRHYLAKRGYYLQQNYGSDVAQVALSEVEKLKIREVEEDQNFEAFLQSKLMDQTQQLTKDQLIDNYVSAAAIASEHERIIVARIAAMKAFIAANPVLAKRFLFSPQRVENPDNKRPRFNLTYNVAE